LGAVTPPWGPGAKPNKLGGVQKKLIPPPSIFRSQKYSPPFLKGERTLEDLFISVNIVSSFPLKRGGNCIFET